jgi:hypothetical protein
MVDGFFILAPARQDDAMAAMAIKKIKPLADPRVESSLNMARDLAHDMLAVFEPRQLCPRRCGPNRLLALLALKPIRRHPAPLLTTAGGCLRSLRNDKNASFGDHHRFAASSIPRPLADYARGGVHQERLLSDFVGRRS